MLPCLHTFCADCVGQLEPFSRALSSVSPEQEEGQADITVLCPDCDSKVDLPPSGLSTDHLVLDTVFLDSGDGPATELPPVWEGRLREPRQGVLRQSMCQK